MAYTNLNDFYRSQFANSPEFLAANPNVPTYQGGRTSWIANAIPTLEDNKAYSFSDTAGSYLKQGDRFVPILGDASQYGSATKLDFASHELAPTKFSVSGDEYGIKPGGTVADANAAYSASLNDSATPRVVNGVTMTGQQALDQQAATRASVTDTTSKPNSTYVTNAQNNIDLAKFNVQKASQPYSPTPAPNNNRTLISDKQQPGYIKGYDTNNGYKPVYVPAGTYVPGVSLYPQNTKNITPDKLTTENPVVVPGGGTGNTNADATTILASADQTSKNIDKLIADYTATKTAEQTQATDLTSQLLKLLPQEAGQSAALASELAKPGGADELTKQLQIANNQLKTLQAEATALKTDQEGKPVTMNTIIGADAQIAATYNSRILTQTAIISALTGDVNAATDAAHKAVDAKYAPIFEKIAIYQAQLAALQPTLTKQEKIQADTIQSLKDEQKSAVTTLQADLKTAMSDAISKGITDPTVLNKIANATSGIDALGIVAQNLPASAGDHSPIYKEWQDAVSTGYKGTFTQYENEDANRKRSVSNSTNIFSSPVPVTGDNGQKVNVPANVAPYYNTSSSGVGYIDASKLQGTAKDKTAIVNNAQKAGLKIIFNTGVAQDLSNIKDANAKLDSISTIMSGIAQPGWVSRTLGGIGLTKLSVLAQSDPQKAASGALSSVGLDILKAISGVQGFRGNQSAIQQVTDHLPSIYDTTAVVNQKVAYIKQLISDRENALVGNPVQSDTTHNGIILPQSNNSYGGITLPN